MKHRWKVICSGVLLILLTSWWTGGSGLLSVQPGLAQIIDAQDIADQVYLQLPSFPQENQYIRKESGQAATDSTLVKRLIQYHTLVKGRSPIYRFDWKITLADYLGLNDYLVIESYPGKNFLKTNPLEGDRTAIQQLNRTQREDLIRTLVAAFTGKTDQEFLQTLQTVSAPTSEAAPASPTRRQLQPLSQPGKAHLLLPSTPDPASSETPSDGDARLLRPQ